MVDALEREHGLTTDEMRALFRSDARHDTAEFSRWLILAKAIGR
jgi:hypothetical protein